MVDTNAQQIEMQQRDFHVVVDKMYTGYGQYLDYAYKKTVLALAVVAFLPGLLNPRFVVAPFTMVLATRWLMIAATIAFITIGVGQFTTAYLMPEAVAVYRQRLMEIAGNPSTPVDPVRHNRVRLLWIVSELLFAGSFLTGLWLLYASIAMRS